MSIEITRDRDPAATRRILSELPEWFGIPEANEHYSAAARDKDSYLARGNGRTLGVLLADRHFPQCGEIHLVAVDPSCRGMGIGSALVGAFEDDLRASGAVLMEVKTVGPTYEHAGYAATRAFYEARGFLPVEEVPGLDWDGPTVIFVKPLHARDQHVAGTRGR